MNRVTAAQAADELLNIIGIDTSFVLSQDGERVNISARSMGDTNVQVILEQLGGGGNAAAAGGQVTGKPSTRLPGAGRGHRPVSGFLTSSNFPR